MSQTALVLLSSALSLAGSLAPSGRGDDGRTKSPDLGVNDEGAIDPVTVDPLCFLEQAKLLANDGAAFDSFGRSASISGDSALVGAPGNDDFGDSSGSAYVFARSGTTWTQQAKLVASGGAAFDSFGYAVSLSGDTALIGADGDDDNGPGSGAAYVFVRNGTSWTQQAKLVASDGTGSEAFGWSVSLSGDTALVGAFHDDDNGSESGSVYVFVRAGTSWTQQAKLLASDGAADDELGKSVSLTKSTFSSGELDQASSRSSSKPTTPS